MKPGGGWKILLCGPQRIYITCGLFVLTQLQKCTSTVHIVLTGFVNVTDPNVTPYSPSAKYVRTSVALHSGKKNTQLQPFLKGHGHHIMIRLKWYGLIGLG
jgi:hypothetical protein